MENYPQIKNSNAYNQYQDVQQPTNKFIDSQPDSYWRAGDKQIPIYNSQQAGGSAAQIGAHFTSYNGIGASSYFHSPHIAAPYRNQILNYPNRPSQQYDIGHGSVKNGYFFESPSKFVSLENFKQQNSMQLSDSNSHTEDLQVYSNPPYFDFQTTQLKKLFNAPQQKNLNIKEWFEQLSIADKSIVLTVVDKQLTQLIIEMYCAYKEGKFGKFIQRNMSSGFHDPNQIKIYYINNIHEAEKKLVDAVRLINLNQDQGEKKSELKENGLRLNYQQLRDLMNNYDSLTLDVDFYSDNQVFFDTMELVMKKNYNILSSEYQGSDPDYTYNGDQKKSQDIPQKFYTMVPQNRKTDEDNGITLGQCLVLIFEKAINIQYHDYLKKLSKDQKEYFFVNPHFNIFFYDQLLTAYWIKLSDTQQNAMLNRINEIESNLVKELEQFKKQQYAQIQGGVEYYQDQQLYLKHPQYHLSANSNDFSEPFSKNSDNNINANMFMIPKLNIISEQKKLLELQRQNSPNLVKSAYTFIKKLNSSLNLEMIKQIHVHYLLKEKFYLMIKDENQKSIDKDLGIDSKQSAKHGQAKHEQSNHEGGQQPGKKNKKKKKGKQGANVATLQEKGDQSLIQQNPNLKQSEQQTKHAEKVMLNPSLSSGKNNQPEKQIKLETIKEQEQRLREQQTLKFVRQMMIDDKPELETLQDQISFSRDKLEERQSLLTGQLVLNRYHDEEAGLVENESLNSSTAQNNPIQSQNNKKKKKKRKSKVVKQQQPANEKTIEEEMKNELADHKQYKDDIIQLQATINETFSQLQEKDTIVQNEVEDQQDDIKITQRLAQEYTVKICANIISTYDDKEETKPITETISSQSQYVPPTLPKIQQQPIKSQQETEQKYLSMKQKYGKKPRGAFTSNKPKQPPVPIHKINNEQHRVKDNMILNSSLKCQQLESIIEEDNKDIKRTEENIQDVLEKLETQEQQEVEQILQQDSKIESQQENPQIKLAAQQLETIKEIVQDKAEENQTHFISEPKQSLQENEPNQQIHQDKEMTMPQYQPKQKHGDNNSNYKESKPPLKDRKYVKKQPQQQQVKYDSYEDMFKKNFEKSMQKKIFETLKHETIDKSKPEHKSEEQSPSNEALTSEAPTSQQDQSKEIPLQAKQPQQQQVSHLPLNPNTHKYKKNKNSGEKKEMGICANPSMTNEARKQTKKQKNKILINNQDPQTSFSQPQTQLINPSLHQQRSSTPQNELQIEPLAPIITGHQQQSIRKPIAPTPQNQSSKQGSKNQKHGKHHPSKKKNSSSAHGHSHGHGNQSHTHGHGHGHHSQQQHVSYPQQDLKQQSYHLNHQQSFNQQQMQQAYYMQQQQQQQQQQQYMMPFQFLTPQFFLPPQQIFSQQQMPMTAQPYLPSSAMGIGSQSQPHIQLSHSPQPVDYNMLPENVERNSQQTQTDETRILTNENPMQFSEKRYSKSPPLLVNQYQSFNGQMAPPMSNSPYIPPQNQYNPIQYTNQWQPNTEVFNSPVLSHANSQNLILSLIQSAQSPQFNPNPSMLYHQMQNIQSPSPIFSPQPPAHHFDMNYPFQSPPYWQYGQQQHQLPPSYNNSNQQNNHFNTTSLRNNNQQNQPQVRVSHENLEDYQRNMIMVDAQEHFYFKLNEEIDKMANKLKLKLQKTERERNLAFKNIEYYVKDTYQEYPDVQIQMYGSMATGLAIDSSDMDILVQGVFNHQKGGVDRLILVDQMQRLHRQLNNLYCIESNSLIETATVPVIKLVLNLQKIREAENQLDSLKVDTEYETDVIESDMQQLKIDITFDDSEGDFDGGLAQPVHMGIQCCHLIKQKLYEYQPHLEPLVLVLKKFLAVKDLNSPFFGGLSSYGLILLIIAYINQDSSFIYDSQGNVQTSRIFTNFLQFYGYLFETQFQKIDEYTMIAPHLNFQSILTIIDPLNTNNNIGKSTYNFDKIKLQFQSAYLKIAKKCEEFIDIFNQEVQEHENISNAEDAIKIKKLKLIDMIMSNDEDTIQKVSNEVEQQQQNQQHPQSEEVDQQPQSQTISQEQNEVKLVS